MHEEEIVAKLSALVEGKLSPITWVNWWNEHAVQLQVLLPRTAFLKIKPNVAFGDTRATLISQTGAIDYLTKKGIPITRADKYATEWQSEEVARELQQDNADKIARNIFASDFQELKHNFPKLHKCLKKYITNINVVLNGKSMNEILDKEDALQCQFSSSQKLFMQSISALQLDGVKYDFNDVRWLEFSSVKYLVWGEYWLEGDGDLVLFEPISDAMYYLGHGSEKPHPKQLNSKFAEFVERDLVRFIVENEE